MPLVQIEKTPSSSCWALWRITEAERDLSDQIHIQDSIPDDIVHPRKRIEFAAGRLLTKIVLDHLGLSFSGITKDSFGKPGLRDLPWRVSLSHSFPFAAVIVNEKRNPGIDVEQPTPKLLRIGSRVLHPSELNDAGVDVEKHCIYWCAKETLMKVHGKRNIVFAQNLRVEPFQMAQNGPLSGSIIDNNRREQVEMQFHNFSEFVVVHTL